MIEKYRREARKKEEMNLDTKVEVSVGCLNFLTNELEQLRAENKLLKVENTAINRVLSLAESVTPRTQSVGYGEDLLWKAKREIEEAIEKVESRINRPVP